MPAAPPRRVVVAGGGLSGLRTAQGLRRAGFDGDVVLLAAEPHLPYDRPPLSKQVLLGEWAPGRTALVTADALAGQEVTVRLGDPAVGLDVAAHQLRLTSGERLGYDALVVATGAQPHRRPFDRADLPGIQDLRRIEDGVALAAAFDAGARVAVVGAGFIGTEVASAARQRGLGVTVVDLSPTPLSAALGDLGSAALLGLHRDRGVDLRLGRRVSRAHGSGRVEALELDDGDRVPADVVVVGVGVRPATDWLARCGLDLRHGLPADPTGATPLPDVWAVGDVSAWPGRRGGDPRPVEHWTSAVEQAAVVAANLLRPPDERRPHTPLPYVWTDHYGIRFQHVGDPRPGDDVRLLAGSVEGLDFVVAYCREGRVTGTLSAGRPTALPRLKAAVREGSGPEELAAQL